MSRTTIKPVPGYGDVLSDLNQVPVLTLADRVRRDIVLPIACRRSDSVLDRSKAKFLRSANGSPLVNKPPESLSFIEQVDGSAAGGADYHREDFAKAGIWVGFLVTEMEGDITELSLVSPDRSAIVTLTDGGPAVWLRCLQYAYRFACDGTFLNTCYFSMYSFG